MTKTILQSVASAGFSGNIAVVSQSKKETETLQSLGINLVMEPFQDAAERTTEMVLQGLETSSK